MSSDQTPPLGAASVVGAQDAPGSVRVRLTVAYDGSAFHGFAVQPQVDTVGGALTGALERVLRTTPLELTCAGRTDAGVHARGQVVSFDAPASSFAHLTTADLPHAVNRLLAPAVVVTDAAVVDPAFDARFSARGRLYRYTILNRPHPDPFLAATSWHVPVPLDVRAMRMACDPFIGEHDFSSFCRRPKPAVRPGEVAPPVSLTRRVTEARIEVATEVGETAGGGRDDRDRHDRDRDRIRGDELRREPGALEWGADADADGVLWLWIGANAFCHQMVRSIAGTLVEVGRGKRRAGDILGIIHARDRHAAGDLAPPHGLCLWSVTY